MVAVERKGGEKRDKEREGDERGEREKRKSDCSTGLGVGRRKRVLCPSLLSIPLLIALIFQRIFVVFDTKKGVSFVFFFSSYVHRIATGPSPLPQQATVSISAHKIIIIVIIK